MTLKTPDALSRAVGSAEDLYRLFFEHGPDGLMLTAPDGSILDANPAACHMLGRTREEIIAGGRQSVIDTSDPRLGELIRQRQQTGRAHGELNAKRKDGSTFPVEISSVVFHDPHGEPKTCIIIRDISRRKATEAEHAGLIQQLRDALGKVKTLTGLLPLCASCRQIRDEHGIWHSLETYIRKNTAAKFSHGICPDCRRRLYPESVRE